MEINNDTLSSPGQRTVGNPQARGRGVPCRRARGGSRDMSNSRPNLSNSLQPSVAPRGRPHVNPNRGGVPTRGNQLSNSIQRTTSQGSFREPPQPEPPQKPPKSIPGRNRSETNVRTLSDKQTDEWKKKRGATYSTKITITPGIDPRTTFRDMNLNFSSESALNFRQPGSGEYKMATPSVLDPRQAKALKAFAPYEPPQEKEKLKTLTSYPDRIGTNSLMSCNGSYKVSKLFFCICTINNYFYYILGTY